VPVEQDLHEHPESLIERAIRGELDLDDAATLESHLVSCADCAAEIEGARILAAAMAPGKQDEALNRAAVENALARLQQAETFGERVRRWGGVRRMLRPSAGVAMLGVAAVVAIGFALHHARRPAPTAVASASVARLLILDDGSEVAPAEGTTSVQVTEQTPARTTVLLPSGSAQFRVRHDSRRLFRVDVGPIEIEDLGTVFRVDHQAGGKIHVAVSEGHIAVLYPARELRVELAAGEERVFVTMPEPRADIAPADEAPKASEMAAAAAGLRAPSRARGAEDPAALLLAADVARRSRRPQAAVAPLRRLVERYPKDPRAPSAAFTLGWVLLTDLGRPREAAAAFAEAERIAPRGALAEDAAARVAEAWQKGGDSGRAAQAARHYEQTYPTGRYLPLTRALIGEH